MAVSLQGFPAGSSHGGGKQANPLCLSWCWHAGATAQQRTLHRHPQQGVLLSTAGRTGVEVDPAQVFVDSDWDILEQAMESTASQTLPPHTPPQVPRLFLLSKCSFLAHASLFQGAQSCLGRKAITSIPLPLLWPQLH